LAEAVDILPELIASRMSTSARWSRALAKKSTGLGLQSEAFAFDSTALD
jgi:hypothetical protein